MARRAGNDGGDGQVVKLDPLELRQDRLDLSAPAGDDTIDDANVLRAGGTDRFLGFP